MLKDMHTKYQIFQMLPKLFLMILWFYPFWKILSVNYLDGHDFSLHIWRIIALENEINQGNLMPTWIAEGLNGFGVPIFSIVYGVPYYIAVFLLKISLSLAWAQKIMMFIPGPLSGLFFYLWAKNKFGNFIAALGSIIYVWTPYHFLITFIRGAVGEMYFFMFFPLVLYFFDKKSIISLAGGALSFALLIYSHNSLALLSMGIYLGYMFLDYYHSRNKKQLGRNLLIILLGVLLSSFYTLPALFFTSILHNSHLNVKDLVFPPPLSLLRSKWEGGSVIDGQHLIMSFQIGLANLLVFMIAIIAIIYSLIKKSVKNWQLYFWSFCFIFSIFMISPYSIWLWEHIPLIINIQLPYRFLALTSIASSGLTLVLMALIRDQKIKIIFAILIFALAILGNRNHLLTRNKDLNSREFYSYHGSYDGYGEFLPSYFNYRDYDNKTTNNVIIPDFELIGNGILYNKSISKYESRVDIEMQGYGKIFIKRLYFPGWNIKVNNQITSDFNYSNGIWVNVSPGAHSIEVYYRTPIIILISRLISLTTLVLLLIVYLLGYKKNILLRLYE